MLAERIRWIELWHYFTTFEDYERYLLARGLLFVFCRIQYGSLMDSVLDSQDKQISTKSQIFIHDRLCDEYRCDGLVFWVISFIMCELLKYLGVPCLLYSRNGTRDQGGEECNGTLRHGGATQ